MCSLQALLAKTVRSWRSRSKELCPFFKECIQNVAQLQPESFDVSWKATWIPRQLLWLDSLGKAWPGVTIQYYDVLDRYVSGSPSFSVFHAVYNCICRTVADLRTLMYCYRYCNSGELLVSIKTYIYAMQCVQPEGFRL